MYSVKNGNEFFFSCYATDEPFEIMEVTSEKMVFRYKYCNEMCFGYYTYTMVKL